MESLSIPSQENSIVNLRELRGLAIAKNCKVEKENDKTWRVPSQSDPNTYYFVKTNGHGTTCNCPDCKKNGTGHKCKHIFAVEYVVTHTIDELGNIVETKVEKKTYSQNWSNYDKSQINEKTEFMKLLKDLVENVEEEEYKFGRPKLSRKDLIYSVVMKVYTTFSFRRFMSDLQIAKEKEYVNNFPCYSSVGHFMQTESLTEDLINLVKITSTPLKNVESDFAIDSTGFGTSQFQRWFSYKHGKDIRYKKWVKCHFVTGVKTNIIPAVKITSEFEADCPQLKELLEKTDEVFEIKEFSGDKAYISKNNLEAIDEIGARPFIPFKSNVSPNSTHKRGMVWKKTLHYFLFNQDDFMEHYHKRSNVESSVNMIKSKFGDCVKSKDWNAQVNEVLCKIICHNICVVINEVRNLGVVGDFCVKSTLSV